MRLVYNLIPLGIVVLLCLAFYHSDLRRTMVKPLVSVATTGPDQPAHAYEAAQAAARSRFEGRQIEFPTSDEADQYVEARGNGMYKVAAWVRERDGAGVGTYLPWSARVNCNGQTCNASALKVGD